MGLTSPLFPILDKTVTVVNATTTVDRQNSEDPATLLPPPAGDLLVVRAAEIRRQLDSVSVSWAPLDRRATCRSCARPLAAPAADFLETSAHCRRCGALFCRRCRLRRAVLPGQESGLPAPVCARCYTAIVRGSGICAAEDGEEDSCETDTEDDEADFRHQDYL